jgi:hypothetical protein
MTSEEHNKFVWWGFLAHGLFQVLMLLLMLVIFALVLPPVFAEPGAPPAALFLVIFGFAAILNLAFIAPSFIAAYGVKNKKSWARIASIIAAAMSVMNMPFGTLAGVHALWFFCGDNWKDVYPDSPNSRKQLGPGEQLGWQEYTQAEDGEYVYRTPEMPDWR